MLKAYIAQYLYYTWNLNLWFTMFWIKIGKGCVCSEQYCRWALNNIEPALSGIQHWISALWRFFLAIFNPCAYIQFYSRSWSFQQLSFSPFVTGMHLACTFMLGATDAFYQSFPPLSSGVWFSQQWELSWNSMLADGETYVHHYIMWFDKNQKKYFSI